MALFRKFFLKKTPDRLLEISERVYGIMLSSLGRAGPWGCWIYRGVSCSGEDLLALATFGVRNLVKSCFMGVELN